MWNSGTASVSIPLSTRPSWYHHHRVMLEEGRWFSVAHGAAVKSWFIWRLHTLKRWKSLFDLSRSNLYSESSGKHSESTLNPVEDICKVQIHSRATSRKTRKTRGHCFQSRMSSCYIQAYKFGTWAKFKTNGCWPVTIVKSLNTCLMLSTFDSVSNNLETFRLS